jgi:DNA-binding Xre family transcriptional regulator
MPTATITKHSNALAIKQTFAFTLKQEMAAKKISKSTLAKKLKTSRTSIQRLLDPKNTAITLQTFAQSADALGLELSLKVRRLDGDELVTLAQQMVDASSQKDAKRIETQIVAGFYGKPLHAASLKG